MSQDKPIPDAIDGTELHFAVIAAGYNGELVDALLRRVNRTLRNGNVPEANIVVVRVPGSGEIPYAAYMSAMVMSMPARTRSAADWSTRRWSRP